MKEQAVSDSSVCSQDSFLSDGLPCPASVCGLLPCLAVFCFVVFSGCLLETCSFLMGDGGKVNWRRVEIGEMEELGGMEEGKL